MLLFPGQPPSQSGRYSVSMSGDLTITDVHPEDSGFYICQAISVAGSVMSKVLLDVEGGENFGFFFCFRRWVCERVAFIP